MKIYISGKITGDENYMNKFHNADIDLHTAFPDCETINPADTNATLPKSTTYDQYMNVSFMLLDMADAVYMLEDWKESHGASMEYGYAFAKDKNILFEKKGSENS